MKPIKFISWEEYQKIYKAEKDKEMKLFLMLGFGAGMRMSEIIGLPLRISRCCKAPIEFKREYDEARRRKVKQYSCTACKNNLVKKDFRYAGNTWEIPPLTQDRVDIAGHKIKIDTAKGGKWRVTITPPTLTEEYVKMLPLKLNRRTVQDRFSKLTIEVLGKKLSPHVLRHGFGNYHANIIKTTMPQIQQLMGHSRIDITGIYTQANPEETIRSVWKAMGGE